jgi:hypothetical protein
MLTWQFFWFLFAIFVFIIYVFAGAAIKNAIKEFFDRRLGDEFETRAIIIKKTFIAGETEKRPYLTISDMGAMRAWPHFEHSQYILKLRIADLALVKEVMVGEEIFDNVSEGESVFIVCVKGKFSGEIYPIRMIVNP